MAAEWVPSSRPGKGTCTNAAAEKLMVVSTSSSERRTGKCKPSVYQQEHRKPMAQQEQRVQKGGYHAAHIATPPQLIESANENTASTAAARLLVSAAWLNLASC
mmetsp:Transcript_15919/g.43310  ORF Transcript_15919/g.43310 Transcript_15919/m.43310 type:complete len:104 (-) Transcript_15919:363-674(-)